MPLGPFGASVSKLVISPHIFPEHYTLVRLLHGVFEGMRQSLLVKCCLLLQCSLENGLPPVCSLSQVLPPARGWDQGRWNSAEWIGR